MFQENDYAALRGFPSVEDGAALLVASLTIGESLRTYRDGKVIKHFKMSPWTTELSHTTREGEFHTDLNTEPHPPAITAIQCLEPDPGSPRYGITRVARLTHLLDFVDRYSDEDTKRFLREDTVTMLNDRSSANWSGRIVEADAVRYHPETIRPTLGGLMIHYRTLNKVSLGWSKPRCLCRRLLCWNTAKCSCCRTGGHYTAEVSVP